MPRKYDHVKKHEKEIFEMKTSSKNNREISEHLGIEMKQLKDLICRHNRRNKKLQTGSVPAKRGRPRKTPPTTNEALEKENRQLRMENELLRDFLYLSERK